MTIILCEDSDQDAELFERLISKMGFEADQLEVIRARSFEETVTEAIRIKPDLIVLDLKLPDSPREQTINSISRLPHRSVLVLSTDMPSLDLYACITHGAAYCADKSILNLPPIHLFNILRNIMAIKPKTT